MCFKFIVMAEISLWLFFYDERIKFNKFYMQQRKFNNFRFENKWKKNHRVNGRRNASRELTSRTKKTFTILHYCQSTDFNSSQDQNYHLFKNIVNGSTVTNTLTSLRPPQFPQSNLTNSLCTSLNSSMTFNSFIRYSKLKIFWLWTLPRRTF